MRLPGDWEIVTDYAALISAACDDQVKPPRYIFFPHWSRRVPDYIYNNHECVNLHCTDLPYGRGGHPIENLLTRHHERTVLTAHRMTAGIDTGPVYSKSDIVSLDAIRNDAGQILRPATKSEILERFIVPAAQLIYRIVMSNPAPDPQDETSAYYFQRLPDEAYRDFWRQRGDLKEGGESCQ